MPIRYVHSYWTISFVSVRYDFGFSSNIGFLFALVPAELDCIKWWTGKFSKPTSKYCQIQYLEWGMGVCKRVAGLNGPLLSMLVTIIFNNFQLFFRFFGLWLSLSLPLCLFVHWLVWAENIFFSMALYIFITVAMAWCREEHDCLINMISTFSASLVGTGFVSVLVC